MDTALPQKFPFILDRNLAKANCTENRVCTSCDTVVLGWTLYCLNSFLSLFLQLVKDAFAQKMVLMKNVWEWPIPPICGDCFVKIPRVTKVNYYYYLLVNFI